MTERWRVKPGQKVHLGEIDPTSTAGAPGNRAETESAIPDMQAELDQLQNRLAAENRRSLLVVLQGTDSAGKDGTIRHVFSGVNPQGTRVAAFKEPTALELSHDFLWRIHPHAPATGEIAIFNRSHYEDVLVPRVHRLVPESVWRARFALITCFEETLHQAGTTIVKLFLHISRDEQERRLQDRLHRPDKRWKFQASDLQERSYWDEYQAAYEDALSRTSTSDAPWYVIPADHKWFRNWAVSTILIDALRTLNPQYPDPFEGKDS